MHGHPADDLERLHRRSDHDDQHGEGMSTPVATSILVRQLGLQHPRHDAPTRKAPQARANPDQHGERPASSTSA